MKTEKIVVKYLTTQMNTKKNNITSFVQTVYRTMMKDKIRNDKNES